MRVRAHGLAHAPHGRLRDEYAAIHNQQASRSRSPKHQHSRRSQGCQRQDTGAISAIENSGVGAASSSG